MVVRILALLAVGLYMAYDPIGSARLANWGRGWALSYGGRESWFLGYGLGSWIFLFPKAGTSFHRAHNEPLQVFFELGFMGVLAMLLYGRFLILRFLDYGRTGRGLFATAGMAAVVVSSLGNFPFHLAGTAILAVGWMAMFDIYTRRTALRPFATMQDHASPIAQGMPAIQRGV